MGPVERKRPWYLMLALLGALAIGTAGVFEGLGTFAIYNEPIDTSLVGQGISDEADRLAVVARFQAYIEALDAAKTRKWPLAAAALVLGAATFVFAMRTLGGNRGARAVLVQLVMAQGATNAAGYLLLRDVFDADLRVREAEDAAQVHDHNMPEHERAEVVRVQAAMRRAGYPIALAIDTLSTALIVVALTRRRTRAFFESPGEALGER
jgi:hypothetical protein